MVQIILSEPSGTCTSLSQQVLCSLTSFQQRIYSIITALCLKQSKKSPSGSAYCYVGQGTLAQWVGCSRSTVNRAIKKLVNLGLISIQYRKKVKGYFRTLLYFLGPVTRKGIVIAKALILKLSHRVSSVLHISSDKDKISSPKVAKMKKPTKINDPPAEDLGWNTLFQRRTPENLDQCK